MFYKVSNSLRFCCLFLAFLLFLILSGVFLGLSFIIFLLFKDKRSSWNNFLIQIFVTCIYFVLIKKSEQKNIYLSHCRCLAVFIWLGFFFVFVLLHMTVVHKYQRYSSFIIKKLIANIYHNLLVLSWHHITFILRLSL